MKVTCKCYFNILSSVHTRKATSFQSNNKWKRLKEVDDLDFLCESKSQLSQIPLAHRFSPLNLFLPFPGDLPYKRISRKAINPLSFPNTSLSLLFVVLSPPFPKPTLAASAGQPAFLIVYVCLWAYEGIRHPYHTLHSSRVRAAALGHASALLPQNPNTHAHTLEKSSFLFRDSSHTRPSKEGNLTDSQLETFLNSRPKYHRCHRYHNAQGARDAVQSA